MQRSHIRGSVQTSSERSKYYRIVNQYSIHLHYLHQSIVRRLIIVGDQPESPGRYTYLGKVFKAISETMVEDPTSYKEAMTVVDFYLW